uniref:hypothetical protein n=1 Tax=Trichocoleus desertorum TaxID=1481672 RepID=UPI0025B61BEA|nr:hypothetical protein [Trichocoleus desertorum]
MTNLRDRDREIYNQELRREELRRENQIVRENNSAAGGLLTGIVLAALVALGLGALFVFNRGGESSAPAGRQTIIERTREVVPQPQAPDVKPPDVNITVPKVEAPQVPDVNVTIPSPAAPAAPTTETAPAENAAPAGDATSTGSTGATAPAQP